MKIINYIKFSEHGEVLMTGSMPDTMLADQVGNYIEGDARVGLDRIVNWAVVALPEKPGPFHAFNHAAGTWALDLTAAWASVRQRRAALIAASDWTTLADVPLSAEQRAAWAAYRQALRDITDQPDPTAITWPAAPV